MRPKARSVRIGLTFFYFIISSGTLFYTSDIQSCSGADTQGHAASIARLALACTAWNLFASASGALVARMIKKRAYDSFTIPLISALVAGLGFTWFPLWIYQNGRSFTFGINRADVSCFFTNDYGMAIVASVLAMTTLLCEWFSLNIRKQPVTG